MKNKKLIFIGSAALVITPVAIALPIILTTSKEKENSKLTPQEKELVVKTHIDLDVLYTDAIKIQDIISKLEVKFEVPFEDVVTLAKDAPLVLSEVNSLTTLSEGDLQLKLKTLIEDNFSSFVNKLQIDKDEATKMTYYLRLKNVYEMIIEKSKVFLGSELAKQFEKNMYDISFYGPGEVYNYDINILDKLSFLYKDDNSYPTWISKNFYSVPNPISKLTQAQIVENNLNTGINNLRANEEKIESWVKALPETNSSDDQAIRDKLKELLKQKLFAFENKVWVMQNKNDVSEAEQNNVVMIMELLKKSYGYKNIPEEILNLDNELKLTQKLIEVRTNGNKHVALDAAAAIIKHMRNLDGKYTSKKQLRKDVNTSEYIFENVHGDDKVFIEYFRNKVTEIFERNKMFGN